MITKYCKGTFKVIAKVIDSGQVGHNKDRYINGIIPKIFDSIHYTEEINIDAILAQIDLEKAFNYIANLPACNANY